MEQHEVQAQRAASIQPQPSIADIITAAARKKALEVPSEDLQREMLAQLYVQNHFLTKHAETQSTIKGHLTFYTIMFIASFVLAIAMFGK